MRATRTSSEGASARRGVWKTLAVVLMVVPLVGVALGCGPELFDFLEQPTPPTLQILNTFGQLTVEGVEEVPAHYLTIHFDPVDFAIPSPASGTVRYVADLNGLTSCLELRSQVTSDLPTEVEAELELLDPSLPAAGGLRFALCNFENGNDELRDAVQTLFEAAFTRDARGDDPQEAAEKFLGIQSDPAGEYASVEVWKDDIQNADSVLGIATAGELKVAAFTSLDLDLDQIDDIEERTFVNPSLYLAPYLRGTLIGDAFDLQRPLIDKVVVEASQPIELQEGGSATETVPSEPVRIRFLLEEIQASSPGGPTLVPYEVRYEMSLVTRSGATITSRDLRSHGVGHMNEFKTHEGATPDHVAPDVADRLYASQSAIPTASFWLYLPLDATSPVPADPSLQNLTTATFDRELDLAATDGANRVFPPGEYELSVKIKEPFSQAEDEFLGYFNLADGQVVPRFVDPSAEYEERDAFATGAGTTVAFTYEIVGAAAVDDVQWRVVDGGSTAVATGSITTSVTSTSFTWDGKRTVAPVGTVVPTGVYTVEIDARQGGNVIGSAEPHTFVVYALGLTAASAPLTGGPPDQVVYVGGALGQIDLTVEPLPGVGTLEIRAVTGVASSKLWEDAAKTTALALPAQYDVASSVIPLTVFAEGLAAGQTEYELRLLDSESNTVKTFLFTLFVGTVDLDVDTDMDGTVDATDDAAEMNDRAIIIDVNNNQDGGTTDSLNGTIDGAADKAELTDLTLLQITHVPTGGKVELSVSSKDGLRIFDDSDTARIGPDATWGGPNVATFDVPTASISAGDLDYHIECVSYGRRTLTLRVLDSGGNELGKDELKVVLNVDREPGASYTTVRNHVQVLKSRANLEGIEARLKGNKPLISWAPSLRQTKSTSYWVSVQDSAANSWLQTGVRTLRSTAGVDSEELYFELVPDFAGFSAGTDPNGYLIFTKAGATWTDGKFKVEITDRTTGEAQVYLDGTSWKTKTHANFMAATFDNYQIGTEPKMSVSRAPGSTATHAKVSECSYKDAAGWHNTSFAKGDISMDLTDGKGVTATGTIGAGTTASQEDRSIQFIDGRTYEIWDARSF